jgi:copper chaperone CopZ
MDCPSCAHKVTTALLTIPSVQDVRVNSFTGQASLTYKEGIVEPVNIAKRTAKFTGYACVVDSSQLEGRHRILRIALPAAARSFDKVRNLPLGVEILNTSCTTPGTVLDVQYDASAIGPRTVVDSFAAVGGSFLPPSNSNAGLQASKELYNLFVRTLISFILSIPVLVFAWAPIEPHRIRRHLSVPCDLHPDLCRRTSIFYSFPFPFPAAYSRHGYPRYTLLYNRIYFLLCRLCRTSHGPRIQRTIL